MNRKELRYLIREFPDRSIRWLLETPDNLRGLMLIAAKEIAEKIDYSKLKLLDKTFIDDSFRKREADMVFTAPFLDEQKIDREIIIYILIEQQSSVDPIMPFRVLYYMLQIWEAQRRDWESQKIPISEWRFNSIVPLVFYTGTRKWDAPLEMKQLVNLPSLLEHFIPEPNMLFFNLKATPSESLEGEKHPFGIILEVMQKEDSTVEEFKAVLELAVRRLEQIPLEEQANWSKLIHFLLAFIQHRRNEMEQSELFDVVETNVLDKSRREEVKSMGRTMAEALIEKGRAEGELKGELKGKAEDLIKLIKIRFGSVPKFLEKKIKSIPQIDHLDAIFEYAITAKTIDEVKKAMEEL